MSLREGSFEELTATLYNSGQCLACRPGTISSILWSSRRFLSECVSLEDDVFARMP